MHLNTALHLRSLSFEEKNIQVHNANSLMYIRILLLSKTVGSSSSSDKSHLWKQNKIWRSNEVQLNAIKHIVQKFMSYRDSRIYEINLFNDIIKSIYNNNNNRYFLFTSCLLPQNIGFYANLSRSINRMNCSQKSDESD